MTRANLTRFALTAPADKAIFNRISDAYANFDAWAADLNEKKIDVGHEIAVRRRLEQMELHQAHDVLADAAALRAQRIYFRVLLLALLDAEDVWKDEQAAKARAKREKETA